MKTTRRRAANGQFVPETRANPEDVRIDYEGDVLLIAQMSVKHKISASTIHRMAVIYGWRPRAPHRVDPNDLIMRMFAAIETQIAELEMTTMTTETSRAGVLAKLVTTLDKLIEIKDAEARKQRHGRRPSREMTALRAKIAERIAELNEG